MISSNKSISRNTQEQFRVTTKVVTIPEFQAAQNKSLNTLHICDRVDICAELGLISVDVFFIACVSKKYQYFDTFEDLIYYKVMQNQGDMRFQSPVRDVGQLMMRVHLSFLYY